jgi:hypothetical protein
VEPDRQNGRESRKVSVGGENGQVPLLGRSADQEIGIGPLDTLRAARVEKFSCALEVRRLELFV